MNGSPPGVTVAGTVLTRLLRYNRPLQAGQAIDVRFRGAD